MGMFKNAFASPFRNVANAAPILIQSFQDGRAALPDSKYETFAREGYAKNELVYACIEELSTSAAEPSMQVRRRGEWRKEGEPVLDLLNRPNPFMDRFEFWATVIMHRSIAGNAYALKVRSGSGRPVELWLMRPDRVKVIPSKANYIARYEYDTGDGAVAIPVEDVIHFKTRNPIDQFYGMPPLMAAAARVDIDNYMRDFVKKYFQSAGVPAGLLNVKGNLEPGSKDEIKNRWRNDYGGPSGWHNLLIIDQNEASFTPMTSNLGAGGLVVPELDQVNEARIAMVFGVPLTIIGARLGVASSSYANKRSDRESFWDEHLAPLYKELQGRLNLSLRNDFPGIEEIAFDLSDVRALQEDMDKIHARLRSDLNAGGITIEEFRLATGRQPKAEEGTYLIPSNLAPRLATDIASGKAAEMPEPEPDQSREPAPAAAGE